MRSSKVAALMAVVMAAAAGTGCTVGPDFVRPQVEAPAGWRIDYPQAAEVANTKWWQQFGDPVLDSLIETALRDNLDVRTAAARIDQFLGVLTATNSQAYPQLGYGGGVARTRASREGVPPIPEPANNYFTVYQGSLNASWQIDLFGRVRRMSEAAQAQVYASQQAQRGVVLTLVAGVATSYIALRALDRQLEIANSTAANFGETARIFDLRFRSGLVSQTEVNQIRSQYQQARTAIPSFEQQIAAVENQLSILLGRDPGPIPRGKTIDQLLVPLIPAGLPSELLERRPDILAAEQALVAANANIGAARAQYYPSLSLTGALGSTSDSFSHFLTGPATTWSVAAGLVGPIFTFGAIEGQVRSAEAGRAQAELAYRQTVLGAFRDANNALVGVQKSGEGVEFQRERVRALREFARLSHLKFEAGLIGYLEVLIADNELFAAELSEVNLQAARYSQSVAVYQAMGGGWVDLADGMTQRPVGAAGAAAGNAANNVAKTP